MDSLSAKKQLLVVINTSLMDNHQTELAQALEQKRYLISTATGQLIKVLQEADFSTLSSYPAPNLNLFPQLVTQELGFTVSQ